MKQTKYAICTACHQPFHGLTSCDGAASPKIKALLVKAKELHEQLQATEQELYDLDYNFYSYTTGVIKRRSER